MILNTGRLFRRLLRTLDIQTVCDIGSMDGADALRFRRMLPDATILALEPNPDNYALMQADPRLATQSITCLPLAASNRAAELPFYVVHADYADGHDRFRRGMSSLHKRSDGSRLAKVVQVNAVRLDELLAEEALNGKPIALWIDTEGSAFEAIEGAEAVLPSTSLIHVEVETATIIGAAQKLFRDVRARLEDRGFVLFATDQPTRHLQFNALFIRVETLQSKLTAIRCWAAMLWVRQSIARPVGRLLPNRIRQKLAALGS